MNQPFDFSEMDRYLSGESPAEERERIARRAEADSEFRALLEALKSGTPSGTQEGWDTEGAWQRLVAQRDQQQGNLSPKAGPAFWQRPGLAVAALIVIALGVGVGPRLWRNYVADSARPALQELRTAAGETRTVTLPDSSRVTLAPGTVLRAPAVFAAADRQVQLEGEAFFDVRADSQRPFIVLTRNARTRVLGTSFLVSEFQTDRAAELVVVTGRVEFGSRRMGQPTVITPGQAARVSEDGALVVRSDIDTAERTAWLQGRLVFRDVSFADAIPALERWYGVDIEVSDSTLARARLTAFFERQSLNEVLDLLAETLGARYERSGNRITYAPK